MCCLHFYQILPNSSPEWFHQFILLSAATMSLCFPTASPVLGQTFDFCRSDGCEVTYLAFPSVRLDHLYICLLAILVFSSLSRLFIFLDYISMGFFFFFLKFDSVLFKFWLQKLFALFMNYFVERSFEF